MQYRIALMSKTFQRYGAVVCNVQYAGKPRQDAQDTPAFQEYNS